MSKEKYHLIQIPPDKSVEITIGGLFYQRLNKLLLDFSDSVKPEQFATALDLIKRDLANKDQFAYDLETLIILLRDIEKTFKDASLTKEEDVELEIPEEIMKLKDMVKK